MKLVLPSTIASHQDLCAASDEFQAYRRWYAHNAIKGRVSGGAASEAPVLSPPALTLAQQWSTQKQPTTLSLEDIEKLIELLEETNSTAPTVTITLAAPATNGLKSSVVAWCREAIAPNVLVSFQFNTTLLGGMVVRSGSHVYDWSFRRQIMDGRGTFPEVLRRV